MKIDRSKYQNQYDYLSSEYLYFDKTGELSKIAKLSHDLFNLAMFYSRQRLFQYFKGELSAKELIDKSYIDKLLRHQADVTKKNTLYRKIGNAWVAQNIVYSPLQLIELWFKTIKAYQKNPSKFTGKPKLPRYLPKGKRRYFIVNYPSKRKNHFDRDGYLKLPKFISFVKFKLNPEINPSTIKQILFRPLSKGYFKIIVQYKLNKQIKYKEDNGKYVGIDPGLNNLFTVVDSSFKNHPLLINGRQVKSINHFYYKNMAHYQKLLAQNHQLETKINTQQGPKLVYSQSNRMVNLTMKRNQQIKDLIHKATKRIIDYTLSCGANTIIVGKNKYQKRSINLGKKANQNFYGIPIGLALEKLKYKANLEGITVIETEESYTSQTSFIDHEKPCKENGNWIRKCKHLSPARRRIHRGIFKSNTGRLINSDVNGAYQIIRKVFSNVKFNEEILGCVSNPVKYNIYG